MKYDDTNRIDWDLLAKQMADELTEEEGMKLNKNKDIGDEHRQVADDMAHLWEDAYDAQLLQSIDTNAAWSSVKSQVGKRKTFRLTRYWSVAAAIAVLVVVSYTTFFNNGATDAYQHIVVDANATQDIELSDGTMVCINGGSELKYPLEFAENERKVLLEGEAFFNVQSDSEKPFLIEANGLVVRVIGTSFNIKSYGLVNDAIVTVATGIVEVVAGDQTVRLNAGDKALFNRQHNRLIALVNDDVNYRAWRTKQIEFVNTPLIKAFETIEQVYKIDIQIENKALLENEILDITFDKDELDFVLKTVCETYHLSYVLKEGKYIVSSNKAVHLN
jgi:ferric-dicitrate binding protein FerR (iron transport regulator)